MNSGKINQRLYFFKLINILAVTGVFALGWIMYYNKVITWSYQYKGNMAMAIIFLVLYFLFVKVYDAFAVSLQRKLELAISQALSALFADGMMYVIICLLYEWFAPVWPLMLVFVAQALVVLVWVVLTKNWYYAHTPRLNAVILHDSLNDTAHLQHEISYDNSLNLFAVEDIQTCIKEEMAVLEGADVVYICAEPCSARDAVIEHCTAYKRNFYILPSINDMLLNSARHVHMFHMPLLQMHMGDASIGYLFVKRVIDIVFSAMALLVLWPFMLIIAIAIKAYDGGPAFYKQVRLTKGGKEFELIKFRSMRVDAEADGVARLSTGENDPRITPIGKFMRASRVDELPQIICILSGKMSIVGPRPERPEIAAKYEETLPEFRLRLQAKAGLTGYAQVYGKYNSTPREKLHMDMIYISRPSIIEDIRLIFTTVRVLFMKESTEGFESQLVKSGEEKVEI